jgi:hypothetical protein
VKTDSHSDVTNAVIVHVVCCREGRLCLASTVRKYRPRNADPDLTIQTFDHTCDNDASMSTPAKVRSVAVLGTNRHPIHFIF